jgi:hypothetical protein
MKSALNTALMVTGAAYRVCESTSAKSVSLFGQRNEKLASGALAAQKTSRSGSEHRTPNRQQ